MEKTLRGTQSITNLQVVLAASRTDMATTTSDWKQALPVLTGSMVTLRELRISDATSLLAMLSTEEVARLAAALKRLRAEGAAILVVEHNIDFVSTIADEVVVMESGRLIARGTPATVIADPAVQEAYFGALA